MVPFFSVTLTLELELPFPFHSRWNAWLSVPLEPTAGPSAGIRMSAKVDGEAFHLILAACRSRDCRMSRCRCRTPSESQANGIAVFCRRHGFGQRIILLIADGSHIGKLLYRPVAVFILNHRFSRRQILFRNFCRENAAGNELFFVLSNQRGIDCVLPLRPVNRPPEIENSTS